MLAQNPNRGDDGRDVLAEREFTWQRDAPAEGVAIPFDPSQIAELGGGAGKYVVTFLTANREKLFDRDFKLTEPE